MAKQTPPKVCKQCGKTFRAFTTYDLRRSGVGTEYCSMQCKEHWKAEHPWTWGEVLGDSYFLVCCLIIVGAFAVCLVSWIAQATSLEELATGLGAWALLFLFASGLFASILLVWLPYDFFCRWRRSKHK